MAPHSLRSRQVNNVREGPNLFTFREEKKTDDGRKKLLQNTETLLGPTFATVYGTRAGLIQLKFPLHVSSFCGRRAESRTIPIHQTTRCHILEDSNIYFLTNYNHISKY